MLIELTRHDNGRLVTIFVGPGTAVYAYPGMIPPTTVILINEQTWHVKEPYHEVVDMIRKAIEDRRQPRLTHPTAEVQLIKTTDAEPANDAGDYYGD